MTKSYAKIYLTALLVIMTTFISMAQKKTGIIKGTVKTSDGEIAESVEIAIKNVSNTSSDRNGHYVLKNIPEGIYTLTAKLIGLNTVSQEVEVNAGQTTILTIVLQASKQQLKEVVVSGGKKNKFAVKESDFVSKMPLKNLENPQVYNVISKELLTDQVVTSYDDALKNAPGIDKLWSSTGRAGDGAGYFSLRGFAVQPTLVNGLPGLTNGSLDISNVERIEVIKGPSGTLFGSSLISYGGLINTITKQPFDGSALDLTYTAGSYGLHRVTADLNAPIDQAHKLLFRVNAAFHNENSFQDAGFKKSRFLAPSLSYKLNDKLSFLLNAQFLSSEGTNPMMLFFNRSITLRETTVAGLNYDHKRSFTSNDITIKNPVNTVQGQMNYKLSDQWQSQTVASYGSATSDGFYSYLFEGVENKIVGLDTIPFRGNGQYSRYLANLNATTKTLDIQQNFIGDFSIGGLRNRLIAGLDYFSRTAEDNSSGYGLLGVVTPATGDDTGVLTEQAAKAVTADYGPGSNTRQQTFSAYLSDVINLTPELSAMLSLRVDHYKNGGKTVSKSQTFDQTVLSPKFGLVYQVVKDRLSIFGNYMNGFNNSAPTTSVINGQNVVNTFEPEQANQWEGGFKADLFDGKLTGSLSYYDIKVSNIIVTEDYATYVQGGEQYSKGVELEINANPLPGFNILAGYSKNTSKLENSIKATEGRRPTGAGPKDLANIWLSYKILDGTVKGLGFGFGGNYAGKNMVSNDSIVGIFTIPSYTVLNATVSYGIGKFNFAFKVNNLTDKEYYKGWTTLEPMNPRMISGMIGYHF